MHSEFPFLLLGATSLNFVHKFTTSAVSHKPPPFKLWEEGIFFDLWHLQLLLADPLIDLYFHSACPNVDLLCSITYVIQGLSIPLYSISNKKIFSWKVDYCPPLPGPEPLPGPLVKLRTSLPTATCRHVRYVTNWTRFNIVIWSSKFCCTLVRGPVLIWGKLN